MSKFSGGLGSSSVSTKFLTDDLELAFTGWLQFLPLWVDERWMKHWKKRLLTDINCYIVFQGKTESWNEKWVDDIILLLVRSESEKPVIKAVQVRKHLRGISWVHIENVPSFFFYFTVLLLKYNQTFLSSLGVWKKFNIDWSQTRECMTKSIESVFSLTDQQSPNILPFTYHRSGVVGLWLTEDKKE